MFEFEHIDLWYGRLLNSLLTHGDPKGDRTGTGTLSMSGGSVAFNLQTQFPALTLKKTNIAWAFDEMEWFLSGDCSNIRWLRDERLCPIWNEWADAEGNVGPIYGCQWRRWQVPSKYDMLLRQEPRSIDQIAILCNDLLNDPWSRRMIVEGWNPALLPERGVAPNEQASRGKQALPPCHKSFQCLVRNARDPHLDLILYLRSSDSFLGLPFNIAQYAFLTHALARFAGMKAGALTVHFGDLHLYQNHVEQANEVVGRWSVLMDQVASMPAAVPRPQLKWADPADRKHPWDVNTRTDFVIDGYSPQAYIGAPVSV